MNNPFIIVYGALMAQPQMNPPLMTQPGSGKNGLGQELASYTLSKGQIKESDIPRATSIIEQVLKKISTSLTSSGRVDGYIDLDTVKAGIFTFLDWLNRQGCVQEASTTYDIETTDEYAGNIFVVYPGQLPFDIVFNMRGDVNPQYRLLIFVSRVDLLSFGNLMENTSLAGIPVAENWPSGYLLKRP